ncbi:MAG: ABC transporter substrate-binding protein [Treponema sp.]|nr:ABC transporter substrate-binding protein [Treponema sp.]
MKKIRLLALAGILTFLASSEVFSKTKEKIIKIGSANGEGRPFNGLAGVAIEKGFFEEEFKKIGWKVEYVTFSNGVVVNEALLSNDLDFAAIGDVPGVTGFRNNIGVVWVGTNVPVQPLSFATRKGSGIKKPEDLIGKSIGLNLGTNGQFLFENYIKEHKLPRDKLNVVNITTANSQAAVVTGDIDLAVGTSANLLPITQKGDAEDFYNTTKRPEWSAQTIITARKKFLKQNPEAANAFFRALIRANAEVHSHPEESYHALSGKRFSNDSDLGPLLYNANDYTPEVKPELIARLQNLHDILRDIGRVKGNYNIAKDVDNSYYNKALKEFQAEGYAERQYQAKSY